VSISLRIFKQIKRDKRTLGLMIIAPIIVTLLFSWAFSGEITNVPVSIYNEDSGLQDKASSYIISLLSNNSNMGITVNDEQAFEKLGNIYQAIVVLPENMTETLITLGNSRIKVFINVTTSIEAQILAQYLIKNISEALTKFLNVNQTNIDIEKTIQFPIGTPPLNLFFNVCIIDNDKGFTKVLGNLIIEKLSENSDVNLKLVNSTADCYNDVVDGKSVMGVVIPKNFTRALLIDKKAKLISYVNGVEREEVETAFKAVTETVDDVIVSVFGKRMIDFSREYIYGSEDILMIDFFAPSFLGFIAMFFAFIISGVLFLRERLLGTLERMLASALTTTEIVFGYLLTFTVVATIQSALIVATTLVFSTEILKNFLFTYFLVLLLAIGSVSLSIFLSSYMKTELQVVQMIPIYIVPQIFLSGLIIPLRSFPEILLPIAYILPLTYYVEAVKKITFMNATIIDIWLQLTVLIIYFLLGIILGIKKFRKEIT